MRTEHLTAEEYHDEREHDSNTTLSWFAQSPALYYETRITGRIQPTTTDRMRLGNATHAAILQPDKLSQLVKVIPQEVLAKNGARSGNAWKEWLAANGDAVLVKQHEYDLLRWQVDNVWQHPIASRHLRNITDCELSCFFQWNGTKLKARFDAVDSLGGAFCDLKCTAANIGEFWRHVKKFGYHRQAALYSTAYHMLYGVMPIARWIVVQDAPPFEVWVRTVPRELIDAGALELFRIFDLLADCRSGKRPWVSEDSLVECDLDVPSFFYQNLVEVSDV